MLTFRSPRTVAIGEAMIEMAVIGDDTYRRSYAGDTFNTAWHMSQLAKGDGTVGFVTKVGQDFASNGFVAQLAVSETASAKAAPKNRHFRFRPDRQGKGGLTTQ